MSENSENKTVAKVLFTLLIIGIAVAVLLGQLYHDEPTVRPRVFTAEDSLWVEKTFEDNWTWEFKFDANENF